MSLSPSKQKQAPAALGILAFAAYLAAGAYTVITSGRWPVFLPPQFDLLYALLGVFGVKWSIYLASVLLAIAALVLSRAA